MKKFGMEMKKYSTIHKLNNVDSDIKKWVEKLLVYGEGLK